MTRPRAADDFATIRARMEELRRERGESAAEEKKVSPAGAQRRNQIDEAAQRGEWRVSREAVRQWR
jgi:hypothetical protein